MSIESVIPSFIKELATRFDLYIVGGSLRDIFLKKTPKDFDLAGKNIENALKYLKNKGKIVPLDEKEKEYRVVLRDYWIDISELRGKDIYEDLSKRDFTINSIAYDVKSKKLIDPYNGQEDIERKVIRTLSIENLKSDPLRVLRAFRFYATLGFSIEEDTLRCIKDTKEELSNTKGERIRQELLEILASSNVYKTFKLMCETLVMDIIFPEVSLLRKTSQRYYNNQNLLYHSLTALKNTEKMLKENNTYYEPVWLLGAFLHDIGKPFTLTYDEEGNTHFHGHDKYGAQIVEERLKKLRFSSKEVEEVKKIVAFHMYPHHLASVDVLTKKAVARFLRRAGKFADFLLLFALADAKASPPREGGMKGYVKLKKLMDEIRRENKNKVERIITGYDLIDMGFKPSPLFKTILEDVQDEYAIGNLKNKEEALKYIIKKYKKEGGYAPCNSRCTNGLRATKTKHTGQKK